MILLDNFIISSLCLFFPIRLYLNYTTYIKNIEIEEKSIYLEFTLLTALILMLKYANQNIPILTLASIPLIIILRKNNIFLYTIMILILTITSAINPLFLILKYFLYLLTYKVLNKNPVKQLIIYTILEIIFLITYVENIISIFFTIIMFVIYNLLILVILKKGNQSIELGKLIQELEHEKLLRTSISKLTHELKNPIAVCQGYLEMIDESNHQKTNKYLKIIKEEINRSKTIIDEFSSYGKLKQINCEEMDLSYLFEDIEQLLTPLFKSNKSKLIIEQTEEIYLEGDYNKLKQVFINLLKNTIEAKKEKEQLEVVVKIKKTKNNIKITVKDNGIGMSESTLSKVSEVFFTTKQNGTGLGLAYSKEVIELHKGILKIKSKENEGTEIEIILPKRKKSEDFNKRNY